MKKKSYFSKTFARMANLKPVLLLMGLSAFTITAEAQIVPVGGSCLQLQPQDYYSRVIRTTNLSPGNFVQSDFDGIDKIYVPSTFGTMSPTEAYLTAVNVKGYLDNSWGKRYSFTGNERCMASKVVTGGDIVVAGTSLGSNGNSVVFVMRVQNNGTLLWAKYFDQSVMTVDHRVIVTETNISNDIIVAASSENTDNHVLIRLNKTGGLIYYDDHAMYAAPSAGNVNTDEYFAVINGITATSDDGYVVVGCTGEFNSDFYAATAMKYDANFSSGGGHTPAWLRTYRHKLLPPPSGPTYDLNQGLRRSSTFAKGVMRDNGEIVVVGYQGNHDRNFMAASYQKGFIWVLDENNGTTNNIYNYDLPNFLVSFNGIALDNNTNTSYRYIVTGSVSDLAGNNPQTLLARIQINTASAPFTTVPWANTYGGGGSKSEGFNAFYNSSTHTYLSVGISDENSPGTPQYHVISVEDLTGTTASIPDCQHSVIFDRSIDTNDKVDLVEGTITRARATVVATTPIYDCATMEQICGPECVQTPQTPYYSRVLTAHINQDFLKADFNQISKMAFVPANYDGGIGTSDPFWSKVGAMSKVEFSKRYNLTGSEHTRAIKESAVSINNPNNPSPDVIIAGTTVNSNGNHILYVMRTDYLGNQIWYREYDQNNTDITGNVVLTESAIRKDVVVMACGGGSSNSYIHLRLDRWGTIHYYQDFPVFANGNAAEINPVINDIAATSDDGYVIVGSSGHNNDFVAATAYKYDAGYNIISVHSLNWTYVYRRQSAGYNLNIPGQRSWSEARGVTEASNGEIFIVGSTSDRGVTPFTATFNRGFITKLSSGGSVIKQRIFYSEQNFQVDFNDVIKDSKNNLVVTGDTYDPNHQWYHTLVAKFEDDLIFTTNWAYLYESFGMNKGFSIFENIDFFNPGYLSIGITNYKAPEFYTYDGFPVAVGIPNGWGVTAPHILSVDTNGKTITNCYFPMGIYGETTQNDPVNVTDGFATGATIIDANVPVQPSCVFMTEQCTGPFYIPQNRAAAEPTGLNEADQAGTELLKLYPNPATEAVTVEMRSELQGGGQILVQDLQGRTILSRNVHFTKGANRFGIDLSNLDNGIYLIRISDNEQRMSFPVSKVQKY